MGLILSRSVGLWGGGFWGFATCVRLAYRIVRVFGVPLGHEFVRGFAELKPAVQPVKRRDSSG